MLEEGGATVRRAAVIAIDTNVVVRYLVNDHPSRSGAPGAQSKANRSSSPLTVALETEWVLRAIYRLSRARS